MNYEAALVALGTTLAVVLWATVLSKIVLIACEHSSHVRKTVAIATRRIVRVLRRFLWRSL